MPTKKDNRKPRRPRRRGTVKKPSLPLTFSLPTAERRTLAYETVFGLTESAPGAGDTHSFRLNSIFDPDFTGVGVSAMGYSTYNLFYTRYRVLAVRVYARVFAATGVAGGAQTAGFITTANSTFTSNPVYWPGQRGAVSAVLSSVNGGANVMHTFDKRLPLHVVAGITADQYRIDQDYGAVFGANPVTPLYLHFFVHGLLSSSAEVARVDLRLIYDVELSQPLASITP